MLLLKHLVLPKHNCATSSIEADRVYGLTIFLCLVMYLSEFSHMPRKLSRPDHSLRRTMLYKQDYHEGTEQGKRGMRDTRSLGIAKVRCVRFFNSNRKPV